MLHNHGKFCCAVYKEWAILASKMTTRCCKATLSNQMSYPFTYLYCFNFFDHITKLVL